MDTIERARKLLIAPKAEWEAIAADTTPTAKLITAYVLPLAAYAAVAGFVGSVVVGTPLAQGGVLRAPVGSGLATAVLQLAIAAASVLVMGFIIDALAPHFEGQRSFEQAVKVAAYAQTPVWVLSILGIIPWIGRALMLFVAAFAIYQLYLGLPRVMRGAQEKAASYTGVVVILAFAAKMILFAVVRSAR
jgi:hypothetical protein